MREDGLLFLSRGRRASPRLEESRKKCRPTSLGVLFSLISVSFLGATLTVAVVSQNGNAALWDPVFELSTDVVSEGQYNPAIAVNGTEVHVVWEDFKDGDDDIYYRFFNGTDWEPEQELSADVGFEYQEVPSIAVEGDKVHVAWVDSGDGDFDVVYRYFNGTDWEPIQEISTDVGAEGQGDPSIAVEGDKVHVAWMDRRDGDRDIYYRLFNGTDWEPVQEISMDVGAEDQWQASVGTGSNKTHVVWADYRNGDPDIYYRLFNGTDWEPIQEISTDVGAEGQRDPSIAVEGDKVHVAWMDKGDGDFDIFYRYFNGTGWEPVQEISTDGGIEDHWYPSIEANGGNVHIVWENWDPSGVDIFYRCFDGANWRPEQEISIDIGIELQRKPSIAVAGTIVHVVWQDERDGDYDIYYRMGIEDFTSPESTANPISPYLQTALPFDVGWTATDDKGLANVSLWSRYSPDNSSWLAWQEWDYNDTISGTAASGSFSFTPSFGQGFYEFYTVAIDTSSNSEAPPPNNDTICGYDTTPPVSSMNPILPYWTMLSPLPMNASAIDLVSKVAHVDLWYRHSVDNATWTLWFLHSTNYSSPWYFDFDFPQGSGFYEFYSIAVDNAGNVESWAPTAEAMVGFADYPAPPSNVNATLTGSNQENVTISWDLSPDDGAGNYMAVKYDIYRGTTYSPSGALYLLHDSVQAGNATYVDVQAGEGNLNNYFYLVCAVNPLDFPACPVDQAAKFTRSLSAGPNLISIPLIQSDESIETVLQTVRFDKAWFYDSDSGEWVWHMTSKPYKGYLQTINNTMGVWVDVTEDSNLIVAGVVPASTSIQLRAGWNLIGFPSFNSTYSVADLKAAVGSQRVEGFDLASVPYHLRVLGDVEVLQAGYGYWVWVDVGIALLLNA